MSYVSDMQNLLQIERSLPVDNPLRKVLVEVRLISAGVLDHVHQATSGTAISRYPVGGGQRQGWQLKYQAGNLGNLVHELTHAVTHQQYETDGITYASNRVAEARRFGPGYPIAGQSLSYCENEETRQMQFRDQVAERWMMNNMNRLYRWARQYGLTQDQLAQCSERRVYGVANMQREYDTLINQMLVWLYQWGRYPLAAQGQPRPSFPLYLELAVLEAHDRRQNQRAIGNRAPIVPEPPSRDITITSKVWKDETYRFATRRSTELERVDAALVNYHASVGVSDKFMAAKTLRERFDAWKLLHANTKRNKGNIVDLLDAQISAAHPY